MDIDNQHSDDTVLAELGERIARERIRLELTQAEAAAEAGISKRTLERIEAGASTQSANLVRILRALKLLPQLNLLIPNVGPSPIELLRNQGKERQRASRSESRSQDEAQQDWYWDDDQDGDRNDG